MTVRINDPDFALHLGDVREVLLTFPRESVDCVVTSPPYWALRDYGNDAQLGSEYTSGEYVRSLVMVFRKIRRVLAAHGTVWLNLGDTYANKELSAIPWRVAIALQADGWYLRSDIVWSKPNPMPESVTDRPTKAHEYVFLLSRSQTYWFDQEAVREPHKHDGRKKTIHDHATTGSHENHASILGRERWPNSGRNIRSVWEISTRSYEGAHFATYPEELVRKCIRAGCPFEVCRTCGKPRERIVDVGWTDCGHDNYRTGVVLDPFMGSGTTALVARKQSRHVVGIELNPDYADLCAERLQQLALL